MTVPLHSQGAGRCPEITQRSTPTRPTSSFVEGGRDYFLVDDVEWGESQDGAPYVTVKGQTVELSKQRLRLPDGTSRRMRAADIAIKQAVVFSKKQGKTTVFCIAAPTAGLGQSGSYQRYFVLMEFDDSKPLLSNGGFSASLTKR